MEKGSEKLADRYFDEAAQGFLDLEWDPEKQVLFPRRLSLLATNPKRMQLRVGPIEGRHESMMRAMLTLVAGLRRRIRELEAIHPELNEKPQDERSDMDPPKDTSEPKNEPTEAAKALAESIDEGIRKDFGS